MSPYDRALNYLTDLNVVELALTGKLGEIQSEKRRVGIFIEMYQRFSLEEPRESEQTGANGSPSAEVVPAAVESATAEEAPSSSAPTAPSSEGHEGQEEQERIPASESGTEDSSFPLQRSSGADAQLPDSLQAEPEISPPAGEHSDAPEAQAEEGEATSPSSATLKDCILAAHAEHPDWNSSQIADHLGAKRSSVSAYCAILGIHFPRGASPTPVPAVEKAPAWADRIEALLKEHPEWTSTDLSKALGQPLGTVVAGGVKHAAVAAFLAQHNNDQKPSGGVYPKPGRPVTDPLSTVTASGSQQAVVSAGLMNMKGEDRASWPIDGGTPTQTAGGQHVAEVRAFLLKYYGNEEYGHDPADPMGTVTTRDRFGIVMVDGERFQITDIGMRMLKPRELFRAQGFPEDYEIDEGVDEQGKAITLTKSQQVEKCGNSVSPPLATALVGANCADLAIVREAAE